MTNCLETSRNPAEEQPISNSEPIVTDFGERTVYRQNLSLAITVPKLALANLGITGTARINFQLVQHNGEKFLKLSPIKGGQS